MKQLKFMLAAATAIGIAAAAQAAAEKTTYLVGTAANAPENFDAANLADQNPVGAIAGYDFQPTAPATEADNESVIKDGALNVNTGTDPLLRALDYQSSVNAVSITNKSLYIDTKVQFTVTPADDPVDAKTGDKLMLYFKEVKDAETGKITATNLFVKTLSFIAPIIPDMPDTVEAKTIDTGVGFPEIEPNEWYDLKVNASAINLGDGRYLPTFTITVGSTVLDAKISLANADTNTKLFPAITGAEREPTLTYVGFAGEGKVDDLLVWTVETISSVDFTLTLGTGVSAVTYVIGSAVPVKITETETLEKLEAAKITISAIDYLVGYTAGGNGTGEYDVSADGLTIDAAEVVINDGTAEGPATTAADLQITNEKFAKDSPAQLTKLTTWAKNYSVSLSTVNGMTFADEEVESEAYLLNCAPTAKAVEDAKAAFKFPAITAGEVPAVYEPEEGYNVVPKIIGADSIEALKTSEVPATADHKFFKAVLTK